MWLSEEMLRRWHKAKAVSLLRSNAQLQLCELKAGLGWTDGRIGPGEKSKKKSLLLSRRIC